MTGPGIFSYSTTAANNINANTGITWDEGMNPGLVNNSARQNMADTRTAFNDLAWFKYGKGDEDYSPVYVASNQFKIAGIDVSAVYHVGRRVRAVGSLTGTIYGAISGVAFSTDTTVSVTWDSGSLSNETLTISISQIPVTGNPIPQQGGTFSVTDVSGGGLTLTTTRGAYTRVGSDYFVDITIVYPITGDSSPARIGNLPATFANVTGVGGVVVFYNGGTDVILGFPAPASGQIAIVNVGGTAITNATLSGLTLRAQFRLPTV